MSRAQIRWVDRAELKSAKGKIGPDRAKPNLYWAAIFLA